jgi:hypothetical protein
MPVKTYCESPRRELEYFFAFFLTNKIFGAATIGPISMGQRPIGQKV